MTLIAQVSGGDTSDEARGRAYRRRMGGRMSERVALRDAQAPGHGFRPCTGPRGELPSWPFTIAFVGFPLWWVLGVIDFVWIPIAAIMILYMVRRRSLRAPRGFGVWLLFLVWATCSVIGLTEATQFLGFGHRIATYFACTVLFLFVYNSPATLTDRFVTGVVTAWWGIVVAGGYLGLLFATGSFRTLFSYVVPDSLLANAWVNLMFIRPLNQYNPESFFQLDPRPSAPFIYTNQWGNIYSLLMPFVVGYLVHVRGTKRFWIVATAIPVSFVPAILTTNRGMLLGLVVTAVYVAVRMLMRRDARGILAVGALAVVALVIFQLLPTSDRLQSRAESPSIVDRAWLYLQSLDAVADSPLFGFGRTFLAAGGVDPVGTQGEFWTVLVSYGVGGAVLFLGWFAIVFVRTFHWRSTTGLAANAVVFVATFEFFYYGAIPHTLPLVMVAAALALRAKEQESRPVSFETRHDQAVTLR